MLYDDMFIDRNPYGPANSKSISHLEVLLGAKLPEDYVSYLLRFNGAAPKREHFVPQENCKEGFRLHHIFGLHEGPNYLRLQDKWKLQEYYDLEGSAQELKEFCVFAQCATGELLYLSIDTGRVHFFDPEVITSAGDRTRFDESIHNGESFSSFISGLMDFSEFLETNTSSDERDDFSRRLTELQKQAEERYGRLK